MSGDLPRRIGFWGGSAIMVGIIIGSGIFQTPPPIAKELGSPAAILFLWVVGGLLSLFGAFVYAELATMFPRSGGMYVYLNEGLGGRVAFTFGWTFMLLIKPFAAAAVGLTFATHFDALWGISWSPHAVACAMVVGITALNAVSLKGSSAVAILLTSLKVLALAALAGLGAGLLKGSAANFSSVPSQPVWMAFAPVMYGILWTYDGWADVSAISGEVRDPGRLLPRILVAGTAATIGLYVAVNAVYFSMVPIVEMRELDTVAPLVMERLLGKAGAVVVTAIIVISTLGATHGAILTGARVTFAQARDGLLFRFLGRIDPRFQTPAVSLWVQAVMACGAILYLRQFKDLSEGYGFMIWIFHALIAAAVMVLRAKRPGLERPYRCWGYPWVPIVFIGVSIAMTVLYIARDWRTTLPWLGVLLLGLPAHGLWKWCSKDDVASRSPERKMSEP
jgi:APA family basic amino acid/polyamine antiporter